MAALIPYDLYKVSSGYTHSIVQKVDMGQKNSLKPSQGINLKG